MILRSLFCFKYLTRVFDYQHARCSQYQHCIVTVARNNVLLLSTASAFGSWLESAVLSTVVENVLQRQQVARSFCHLHR